MTRLITPANPFICTEIDVAFDSDLNDPSESWDWTTLGTYTDGAHTRPRVGDQTIEVTHGRRGESRRSDPSTVDVKLGNGDGALTPRNPSSPYYPGLKRGTPLRVTVQAGLPHLLLKGTVGSRARTANHASLNVPADLAFAVELLSPVQIPPSGVTYELGGKWTPTGNQRSWVLGITPGGALTLFWSVDGVATPSKLSNLCLPCPEAGPYTIGGWFDVNNGAAGNTMTWYTHRGTVDDLRADLAGSVLGAPDIDSGTTGIFASTAPLDVGDLEGVGNFRPYPGRMNRFQVRAGDLSTGTVVANLDCTGLTPGATGTTDSAGRIWLFNEAEITNRRPRFCGRVDKVTAEWGQVDEVGSVPTVAHANVSASGILERLAQDDEIGSALRRAVAAPINRDNVIAAWMLEDGSDSTRAAQLVSGAAPMSIRGEFNFGGDTSYAAVAQQMTIGSGENAYMSAPIPEIPQVVGVNWAVTVFFRIDDPAVAPADTQLMAVDTNGRVSTWRVTISDAQVTIAGHDIDGLGVVIGTIPSDPSWFGTEATVVLEVTDDGINVDWRVLLLTLPAGVGYADSGTYVGDTGVPRMYRNSCTGPPSGIVRGPIIVSVDREVGWLAPADSAYVGEPATQRVFRLCQERGIPVAVDGPYTAAWATAIAAGAQPMGPQRPGQILDLIDECAEVDQGLVGEQRGALGITFRSGVTLRNQDVRLSLSRASRQVVDPFEEVDDDLWFVNDVTTKRPDGSEYRIEDPAIEAGSSERYAKSFEVNVPDDLALPNQAGWRYHLGTWPEPRFPQVWSDVAKDVSIVEDVLGFGVGDRFELADPPPGCPPVDQLADGITEELERFQWRAGLNGRPARPWATAIVDDADFGRVDISAGELTAPFVAGTGTSMSVATTSGSLAVTAVGEFPVDVEVEGVRLRVTAISGASSPQTFTVQQTPVNGVTKTIPAGAEVRLWQGAVVAL